MNELSIYQQKLPDTIEDLSKFVLVGREKLVSVRAEIRAIDKLRLADEVRSQKIAEAQHIAEAVLDAEVRVGELLREIPHQITGRPKSERSGALTFTPKQKARDAAGITRQQADRFVKLADNVDIVECAKTVARESDDIVSRSFVLDLIRVAEREAARQSITVTEPKPFNGLYDIILADPPWKYDFSNSGNRAIINQYPTMSIEDIKAMEVPAAENATLFLWSPAPILVKALEVMAAWDFSYRTCAVWDKEVIGMGQWLRGRHEILLIGIKGDVRVPPPSARVPSVYREKRGAHSKKPNYYYSMIESMFPSGRYLELFARKKYSERWDVWGNMV